MMKIELYGTHAVALVDYLRSHKEDIEQSINDFGDLHQVYQAIWGDLAGPPAPVERVPFVPRMDEISLEEDYIGNAVYREAVKKGMDHHAAKEQGFKAIDEHRMRRFKP